MVAVSRSGCRDPRGRAEKWARLEGGRSRPYELPGPSSGSSRGLQNAVSQQTSSRPALTVSREIRSHQSLGQAPQPLHVRRTVCRCGRNPFEGARTNRLRASRLCVLGAPWATSQVFKTGLLTRSAADGGSDRREADETRTTADGLRPPSLSLPRSCWRDSAPAIEPEELAILAGGILLLYRGLRPGRYVPVRQVLAQLQVSAAEEGLASRPEAQGSQPLGGGTLRQ
jgi:hypothetical protein